MNNNINELIEIENMLAKKKSDLCEAVARRSRSKHCLA